MSARPPNRVPYRPLALALACLLAPSPALAEEPPAEAVPASQPVDSGKDRPPRALASARLAARIVARHKEAIAYVPLGRVSPLVKVLRIDGRLPDERGYLLHAPSSR